MPTMRDSFLDRLYEIACKDKQVILISNDFGAPALDKFRAELSSQFIHIGIAEQNLVNIAAGLAMSGKKIYIYAISPFVPLRCMEQMKVHLSFKNLAITAVVVGAGFSYELSGPTHHTTEDIAMINAIPGINLFSCSDSNMAAALADISYMNHMPNYIRFDREVVLPRYRNNDDFSEGIAVLKYSTNFVIVSTGVMVNEAFKIAEQLQKTKIDAGVVDFYRIKPLNEEKLLQIVSKAKMLVTLEESFLNGGIGSIVASFLTDNGISIPLKRFGIPDRYYHKWGSREYMRSVSGLDQPSVTKLIHKWINGT